MTSPTPRNDVRTEINLEAARAAADEMRPDDAPIDARPIPACTPELAAKFMTDVEVADNGCHERTVRINSYGYSRFSIGGESYVAHRVAFAWFHGPIPSGKTVDHACHNLDPDCDDGVACHHRRCVNPAHLSAESMRDNVLAGNSFAADNLARDCCPRGHPLAGTNLRPGVLRHGGRSCRICDVVRVRERERVLCLGGSVEAAAAAGRAAVAALTGDETTDKVGIPPLGLHFVLGLVEAQLRLEVLQ